PGPPHRNSGFSLGQLEVQPQETTIFNARAPAGPEKPGGGKCGPPISERELRTALQPPLEEDPFGPRTAPAECLFEALDGCFGPAASPEKLPADRGQQVVAAQAGVVLMGLEVRQAGVRP